MKDLKSFMRKTDCFPLFIVYVFFACLLIHLVYNNVLLSDDLARVKIALDDRKNTNIFEYIYTFLNTDTMTSRPVSGLFTALVSYATGYNQTFYYLGYLFFSLSLLFVLKTVFSLVQNCFFAVIVTVIFALIPIGNPLVFSPLMLNAALATIFYCMSVIVLRRKLQSDKDIFLSILCFVLSVLSYEIFLPLVFTNLLLLKRNRLLYIFSIFAVIFFYRQIAEPYLFTNFYHRSNASLIFDFKRDLIIVAKFIKALTYDTAIGLYRSLMAVKFFSWIDIVSLIILNGGLYFYIRKNNITKLVLPTKIKIYLILSFLFCGLIFLLSEYEPSVKGYSSRTMGGVRLFFVILLVLVIFRYQQKKLLYLLILISSISMISIKNAWVYSSHINDKIFSDLNRNIKEQKINNNKPQSLYIVFDRKETALNLNFSDAQKKDRDFFFRDQHFILEEPMFFAPWEYWFYRGRYHWDPQLEVKYFYYSNDEKIKPYYLYNVKNDELILVNP